MMKENLNNKHIKVVAALAQRMKFTDKEIEKALTKFEMDIEDIDMHNVKIYGDAIIFKLFDGEYEGVNIRTLQYLNDYECYNLINPYFLLI